MQRVVSDSRSARRWSLAFILCAGGALHAQTSGVEWLNTATYPIDTANGVSADGSVVVGGKLNGIGQGFSWTSAKGYTYYGDPSSALGVSGDGSVIVGIAMVPVGGGTSRSQACYWKADGARVNLGTLGGGHSAAIAVSQDGATIVGFAHNAGNYMRAFRWTQGTGMLDLGTLGGSSSMARGVSADGLVVAGYADTSNINSTIHAFRWTQGSGMVDLGTLGGLNSRGYGISSDGQVVVGVSDVSGLTVGHAFRWAADGGMRDLGTLTGGAASCANATNKDGSVVVGWSESQAHHGPTGPNGSPDYEAFRWTQSGGMQSVADWVVASGGQRLADGNYLREARGVNADGTVVVGSGVLNGTQQPFIARGKSAIDDGGKPDGPNEDGKPDVPGRGEEAGVLGLWDFQGSLTQPTMAGTILHERLRSAVMSDLQNSAPKGGQFALSSTGIYSKYTKGEADGHGTAGTIKLVYGISDTFRAGFSYIRGSQSVDLGDNGELKNAVNLYGGLVSYGHHSGDGLRGRISFAYGDGHSDITREYRTGGDPDRSAGSMGIHQFGGTLEGGYGFRLSPRLLVTPTLAYEWVRTRLGGYAEAGGSFPARFESRTLSDRYARGGVKVQWGFGAASNVTVEGHYMRRLSSEWNPVSGKLIGLFGFSNRVKSSQDWVTLRAGVDYVPVSISKNLHLLLRYQANLGQHYEVPTHQIEAGFSYFF